MECFTIMSNEIEGRIDPFYYRPEFRELEKKLSKLKLKSIGDISIDLKNGSTPKGGVFQNSGIPYFRSQDFNLFDFEINQYITEKFHKQLSRSIVKSGDILLAVVGATLGAVGYVSENIKEANINQNVVRIRVKNEEVNPKFLAIILSSKIGQKLILRNATIQTQAYINNSQLGKIKVPIPSLETQTRIVALMEKAYSSKKSKESEAQKLLDSINDYVLDELGIKLPELEDKMIFVVNSDDVKGKRIDAYYYQPKFEEVEKAIKKGKFDVRELKEFIKLNDKLEDIKKYDEINYIDLASIDKNLGIIKEINKINSKEAPSRARQKLENGDLLLSGLSGSLKSIAIFEGEENNFIASTGFYIIKKSENYNNYYLWALFRSKIYQMLLSKETTGAIMSAINKDVLLSLKIPFPPLPVQNKIAEEVRRRMQKAEQLQKEAKEELEKAKQEVEKIILG